MKCKRAGYSAHPAHTHHTLYSEWLDLFYLSTYTVLRGEMMNKHRYEWLKSNLGRYIVDVEAGTVYSKYAKRVMSPYPANYGYLAMDLRVDKERKCYRVHEVVAVAAGWDIIGKEINHLDGDKTNNSIHNLEVTDRVGNMQHAKEHHLMNPIFGEKHHSAKVTEQDVQKIRQRHGSGESVYSITKDYPISWQSVSDIVKAVTWRHV